MLKLLCHYSPLYYYAEHDQHVIRSFSSELPMYFQACELCSILSFGPQQRKNVHHNHPQLIKWSGEKGNQIDVVIINFYGASLWRKSFKRPTI